MVSVSVVVWASCCVNRDERFVSVLLGVKSGWPWGGDLDTGMMQQRHSRR